MVKNHIVHTLLAAVAALLVACGPTYPNCDDDDDCQENEFCVNDQCQMCRDDSDCAAGEACNGGRCDPIDGYCDSASPCPNGQECENNRCVVTATQSLNESTNTDPPDTGCTLEPVYFSFDQESLDNSARDILSANVRCIREREMTRVHITGYTDPRGTEEYNLALGDRRAREVMQYMTSLGADSGIFSTSSMGEELAQGESEAGWRLDRKATFTQR